ncbi:MAG: Rv3654c family TadE-like protein [Microbacteriaceae bacterium]
MGGDRGGRQAGAAAVLSLGIIAVTTSLLLVVAALGSALITRHRVIAVADAAAIAAADSLRGLVTGYPCERALAVVAGQGLTMTECASVGFVADVTVRGAWSGLSVDARARAGPEPGAIR